MQFKLGTRTSAFKPQLTNLTLCLTATFLFLFMASAAWAQANPTFTGGKDNNLINTSPAFTTFNGNVYVAYAYNGSLYVASSPNGTTWTSGVNTGNTVSYASPSITVFNGGLYVVFAGSTGYEEITSSDGINFSAPHAIFINSPTGYQFSHTPSAMVYKGTLYLSFLASATTSSPVSGAVATSTDGVNFSNVVVPASGYLSNSGTSLALFTPQGSTTQRLYLAFTTGVDNLPLLASFDGTTWTYVENNTLKAGNDPSIVAFAANGGPTALYIFARSNYSDGNLWVTATYDGVTFSTGFKYAQSLYLSPGTAIGPSGQLVMGFHGNNGSTNLYTYTATY